VFSEYKVEIDRLRRLVEVKNEQEIYENSLLSRQPQAAAKPKASNPNYEVPIINTSAASKMLNVAENKIEESARLQDAPAVNGSNPPGNEVISQTIMIDPVTGKKVIKKLVKKPKVKVEDGAIGIEAIAATKLLIDGKVKKPKVNLMELIKQSAE
jgi:hypothetical protein